jgi:hypothetical protein
VLTVNAVNDPPTLNPLTDLSLVGNPPNTTVNLSGISTGATNEPTPPNLVVTAASSNTSVVPTPSVNYTSPNASGSISFNPPSTPGTSTVSVTVNDQSGSNNLVVQSFVVFLRASGNANPVITAITNRTINEDTSTGPIAFTIGDSATAATNLAVTGKSSNTNLVPAANIVFGGSGSNRTVTVTPLTNRFGTATITVRVTDSAFGMVLTNFTLTVNSVNDLPTISDIVNQTIAEDTATAALAFTVGDVETSVSSLTLAGSSSNTNLVPTANIVFGGSGTNRTVTVTPAPNQTGTATITVTVTDGDGGAANDTFVLTVTGTNDPPVITDIADQATSEDTAAGPIAFTVSDAETPAGSLTLAASSSNTNLVPDANIQFGGSDSNRTVTVTPAANQFGSAVITVTVTDTNGSTASDAFVLTVNAVNDPPTLNALTDLVLNQGAGPQTVNLSGLGTGATNEAQTLAVTAASSNPALIADPAVSYTSPNATGTLTFTLVPTASGTATITVTVNDGQSANNTLSRAFTVTINAMPAISDVADQVTNEDTPTAAIPFTVSDAETPAADLTLTASSSNTNLVPAANIALGGAETNRTVTLTPAANQFGSATITVTVTDTNGNSASDNFVLSVNPVNDPPTLNPISNVTTNEDAGPVTVSLSGISTGATNESQTLVVSARSSNPAVVPHPTVAYTSPNATGTLTVRPATNANGAVTITVVVSDLQAQSSTVTQTFLVTITALNDPPTIADIPNQVTDEDTPKVVFFAVGDVETPSDSLTLSGTSSNTNLVADASLAFGGADGLRKVVLTPLLNRTGTTTIAITVRDASGATASDSFVLTVNGANDLPTISDIVDVSTAEDTPTTLLAFTVGDVETPAGSLTLGGVSSNTNLVPDGNIQFGGSGSNRTVRVVPATNQTGSAAITVTVTDANGGTASDTFIVMVNAVNDPPTITDIDDQVMSEDAVRVVPFMIGDVETPVSALLVEGRSSNPALVPDGNLVFGGAGANRTVTITPLADQFGSATITITVTDGHGAATSDTFLLTVNAVNDRPFIVAGPQSRRVMVGGAVSFNVTATGSEPLSYQWQRDGGPLAGQTNTTLLIGSAQLGDSGNYSVVVSNSAGTAISDPAVLRVLAAPMITEITRSGAVARVSFTTVTGLVYTVEFVDAVTNQVWSALVPVTGNGGTMTVTDAAATQTNRVYRVRVE